MKILTRHNMLAEYNVLIERVTLTDVTVNDLCAFCKVTVLCVQEVMHLMGLTINSIIIILPYSVMGLYAV